MVLQRLVEERMKRTQLLAYRHVAVPLRRRQEALHVVQPSLEVLHQLDAMIIPLLRHHLSNGMKELVAVATRDFATTSPQQRAVVGVKQGVVRLGPKLHSLAELSTFGRTRALAISDHSQLGRQHCHRLQRASVDDHHFERGQVAAERVVHSLHVREALRLHLKQFPREESILKIGKECVGLR